MTAAQRGAEYSVQDELEEDNSIARFITLNEGDVIDGFDVVLEETETFSQQILGGIISGFLITVMAIWLIVGVVILMSFSSGGVSGVVETFIDTSNEIALAMSYEPITINQQQ